MRWLSHKTIRAHDMLLAFGNAGRSFGVVVSHESATGEFECELCGLQVECGRWPGCLTYILYGSVCACEYMFECEKRVYYTKSPRKLLPWSLLDSICRAVAKVPQSLVKCSDYKDLGLVVTFLCNVVI